MLADLRYAIRSLAHQRSFTLVTVLTLALGIGSAAAIFSVSDWILFRANQFPDDVFLVGGRNDQNADMPIRFDYMARGYMEQTDVMSAWAKAATMTGNVAIGGTPVAQSWIGVSPNLFPMLGIKPALGRGFLPGEDAEGADRVIVVSHQFWQEHLGGRADALGWKVRVGDTVCTVVGVLAPNQAMPIYLYNAIYRPLTYRVDPKQPWMPNLFLLGRLRPNVSREVATQMLSAAKIDVPTMMRPFQTSDRPVLSSMRELNRVVHVEIYWVMVGAVGFLYAIASLNASNLVLVRMLGRRRELSIRLALGGGRGRIVRLLAVESAVLSVAGALAGILVAYWLMPLLLRAAGGAGFSPSWSLARLDPRTLAVFGILTLVTSGLVVAIPAVRVLGTDILAGLKDGGAALGESRGLARLRGSFVVLQVAFAVILLAGAGLTIRTFRSLQKVDLGFDPTDLVKVQIAFPPGTPTDAEPRLARLREIQADLQRIPGVRAVGFGQDALLPGYYFASQKIAGPGGKPLGASMVGFNIGFQNAAGIRLKRGRWLNRSNGNEIMVNEAFARAAFPGRDPIGQFVRPVDRNSNAGPNWQGWEVVGVVGDIRTSMREAAGMYIYTPEAWGPANFNTFILRLDHQYNDALGGAIRRNLYAFDPQLVAYQTLSFSQVRDNQVWAERLANSVLEVLAGIALALTLVGVFSVLAYSVDRRMGEFGVRLALGATSRDLTSLVLRRGLGLTLLGAALGIGGALTLTHFLKSLLYGVSAQDPWVLGGVGVILLATSVLACTWPALRATKVDVARLLRSE